MTIPDLIADLGEIGLRSVELRDRAALVEAASEPLIQRYTFNAADPDEEQRSRWVEARLRQHPDLARVAVVDATGQLIGLVTLHVLRDGKSAEVGYWVLPAHRQKGIATRALRAVTAWGLDYLGLESVELYTEDENEPSQAVARACGFERQGECLSDEPVRGERRPLMRWQKARGARVGLSH